VVFRLLFTVPLLILGVDGVRPHHHINESMLWTGIYICWPCYPKIYSYDLDFLAIVAGFGVAISSGITLVVRTNGLALCLDAQE
jgi:hypothetical protein